MMLPLLPLSVSIAATFMVTAVTLLYDRPSIARLCWLLP